MSNLSRRQFLTSIAALGLGAFTVASCTSGNTSSSGSSGKTSEASEKVLKVGALGKAASAQRDPYKLLPNDSDMLICSLIWEALTVPGADKIVAPRLMEQWKQLNPMEWEFTIAAGAKFHDGSAVTPKDVVWSLTTMLSDEANGFRLPVEPESIVASGERAVRMKTATPNSQLPMLARLMTFVMKEGSSPEKPVGSGPFQLMSWDNGSAKLKRFDDYHGTVAGFEEIHVVPFEDTTAMTNALLAGQIDLAQAVGPIAARSAENNDNVQIVKRSHDSVIPLIMRTSDGPFADPKVREALRLGVDREQVVQRALSGYGSVAHDILGTGDPNIDSSLVRHRDVEKAKALLTQAGFDTSKTYDLFVTPEAPGQVEAMKVIAEQLGEIGVRIKVVEQESGQFYDSTWTKADLYCGYWGTNDSVLFFAGKVLNGAAKSNESNFHDAEFDAAYAELLASTDQAKIDQLSKKLQKIEFERGGYLVWGASDGVDIAAKGLSGLPKAPGYGRVLLETVKKA
ncbi:ABC transporter substrate-binding protein [Corynebacterium ulcerans]|uniref:Oligopeptide-binding protein n=1 Tax=Corynebacterium ulcerans FRC58 TaxID=1408268 RepID=A0ABN4GUZ8_CORUL|nr:ABC transporter substrate-binding protein [Corynebacterium ulcerans]AKN76592.1 Oligopeptide-binding protein [Corynebacterium ulcerans FRC58]MBH5302083.1 ABC transporter substrate-binding protein [Corynebacterium ulcerans]NOL61578.1 ABC transporter substrate-binding protein [Corynebacterium ulcerans]NON16812.1 ABC transporter substrate-binding protein [Corynebacterium ulcerans]